MFCLLVINYNCVTNDKEQYRTEQGKHQSSTSEKKKTFKQNYNYLIIIIPIPNV